MNTEKDYVIFSQRVAGILMQNGCRLKKIKPSNKDVTKFVYFFQNSETVRSIVEQYSN
jgi:hypothetical protein